MPYDFITLKRSVLSGSLSREDPATKWLFVTLILESTEGLVVATVDHLCRMSGLTEPQVRIGLEALQRPDPDSTSPEHDGRRILVDNTRRNTYRIVNFDRYQPRLVNRTKNVKRDLLDSETGIVIPRTLPSGQANPAYEREYKRSVRAENRSETGRDVHSVHSVHTNHQRKGNQRERKEKEDNPPYSPSGTSKAFSGRKPKALQKGNPENAESWKRFDEVYPRPSNGRKLERADARLTWDLLADDGEDMDKIAEGAKRYRDWIEALDKFEYVAMMTTWLNQRRWEESYHIDPNSEDGKKIAAKAEAIRRERRSAHQAKFKAQYDAFVERLALEATSTPEYVAAWKKEQEETQEKRKRLGMTGAIKMIEKALSDQEEGKFDRIRKWIADQEASRALPTFWEWDQQFNQESRDTP
jgi:hypothetical protein